ncbi:hypothetical protein Asp14428_09850 [Actinoplanes sp. NBRC 14428]|uniref:Peptidase inhibitor family I36 n=1 Tax=Pseudosporangium ferrugineum TaxID=439699 RepID=A0A2T0SFQ5_9ACTN|nr:peptidase inhibitor family I36 protein [Pseudosporangium ferrugineum]PRY32242.1 peptidase inhibitor family I36 [Pseudosporangium ferrugineum]BCJ49510.1 hypothetical protein Asp14428_09850 [Actinoplanes sp. NBRC 14428]
MKRLLAAALSFAGAAATIAVASPARADLPQQCDPGQFCVYNNVNFKNGVWGTAGNDDNWGDNWFSNRSDKVFKHDSSWYNHGYLSGPTFVRVYDNYNRTGRMTICLQAGTYFESKPASSDKGVSHGWYYNC